jgi:hypothetical protein
MEKPNIAVLDKKQRDIDKGSIKKFDSGRMS